MCSGRNTPFSDPTSTATTSQKGKGKRTYLDAFAEDRKADMRRSKIVNADKHTRKMAEHQQRMAEYQQHMAELDIKKACVDIEA
jgi:hypothetical protein